MIKFVMTRKALNVSIAKKRRSSLLKFQTCLIKKRLLLTKPFVFFIVYFSKIGPRPLSIDVTFNKI